MREAEKGFPNGGRNIQQIKVFELKAKIVLVLEKQLLLGFDVTVDPKGSDLRDRGRFSVLLLKCPENTQT